MVNKKELIIHSSQSSPHGEALIDRTEDASGTIRELLFSNKDQCFYVLIDGRERIRSDRFKIAAKFFRTHEIYGRSMVGNTVGALPL